MVSRLLAAATPTDRTWPQPDEYAIADLVAERGLTWLLPAPGEALVDEPELTPLEILTACYATGAHARAWQERAQPMPLREAVDAALADPALDQPAALAMVALLPQLRVEQERTEAAAVEAARRVGASWSAVGAALGISKQSAYTWARLRNAGAPSRATARS